MTTFFANSFHGESKAYDSEDFWTNVEILHQNTRAVKVDATEHRTLRVTLPESKQKLDRC